MEVKSYKDLTVWNESIKLVKIIYELTAHFPSEERFGLVSQMRRAAVSIPSNIAEGKSRGTAKDFKHFLTIAFGSAAELATQLVISKELGFLSEDLYCTTDQQLEYIQRMLNKFIFSLKN